MESKVKNRIKLNVLNEDQGVFFTEQLEYMETEVYAVEYAEFQGKTLFDVDESIPPGYTTGAYRVTDKRGRAKWINGAAKDLPRVDASGKKVVYPIHTCGDSFGFDVLEIDAAAAAGRNLETERSDIASYVVEQELDEAIFLGVPDLEIDGLLTNDQVPNVQAAENAGQTSRLWVDKTPDEILLDINGAFSAVNVNSNGKERATKLGLPILQYNDIATRRLTNSDTTVMEFVVAKSPYLTSMDDIKSIHYFAGAGTGATDLMMVWDPNPRKVQVKIPLDTTIMTELANLEGLEIVTPVIARFGGTIIRFPLSMRKVYGI